jgi:hypothetical protein
MAANPLTDVSPLAALSTAVRLAPAEVLQVEGGHLVVSFGVQQAESQLAVLDYDPEPGDRVLVVGDDESGYFVIGVLATARPRPRLHIESSATTGATIVSVEEGDLEVMAPRGAVRFLSSAGVEAMSAGPIQLTSRVAVRLSILDRMAQALHGFSLTRRCAQLRHEQLEVSADKLQVATARSVVKAEDCSAELGALSLVAQRVSTDIGTLLSKVGNAYQTVAGLWQLAADRTRMVVSGTSHHKAQRLYSKAEDVKVKADKIHLG